MPNVTQKEMNYMSDGERALMEAQRRQSEGASPDLEAQARRAGFNSYAEMQAYLMQKERKTGGTVPGGSGGPMDDSGSSRSNPLSWHPRQLLNYVNRKWDEYVR